MAVVTQVRNAPEPLQRSGRDPYQTRDMFNEETGLREMLRGIIVAGRYQGGTITSVGETVTIPEGSVFWLDSGTRQVVRTELTSDVVAATDEAGGDDSLYIRVVESPTEGGPSDLIVIVEAAPDSTPPGPNSLKIGNTAMGVFTVDVNLDKVLAN